MVNEFLNKHKKLAISLAVLIAALAAGGLMYASSNPNKEAEAINQTYTVEYGNVDSTVSGKGYVQAGKEVKITAPVGVTVSEVLVKAGDSVSAGQELASIEPASIAGKLAEAVNTETQIQNQLNRNDLTDYEREALTGQRTSVRSYISQLRDLRAYPVITAPQNGVINEVYLADGQPISVQNTLRSSTASQPSSSDSGVSLFIPETTQISSEVSNFDPWWIFKFGLFLNSQPVNFKKAQTTVESPDLNLLLGDTKDLLYRNEVNSDRILPVSDSTGGETNSSEPLTGEDLRSQDTYINGRAGFVPDTESSNADSDSIKSDGSLDFGGIPGSDSSSLNSISDFTAYDALAFRLGSMDELTVDVKIDERDILDLAPGQEATVKLEALPDEEIKGNISKISSSAQTGTGNTKYDVEVSLNTDKNLKSGMTANVTISTGNNQNVLVIPVDALQDLSGRKFVYTSESDDGTLGGEVDVTTGLSNKDYVEITSGLQAGSVIYYKKADNTNSFTDDMTNVITDDETGEESDSE